MPEFSGKSWGELNDIWPADVRVASEAWKIVSVFTPAWLATVNFMKAILDGKHIASRDFFILCWIHRCEESRENVAMDSWPAMKGMNIGGRLWYNRKSQLTKLGLIENMPTSNIRLYRVTEMGKLIMKKFIENVEQAHKDMKYWKSLQPPEEAAKIDRALQKYCFNLEDLQDEGESLKDNDNTSQDTTDLPPS